MKMFYPVTAALLFATLSALAFSIRAAAATPDGSALQKKVSYADLDLSKPQGIEKLYGRLRSASHDVCQPLEGRALDLRARWQSCVSTSMADAVNLVNNSTLTAYHLAHSPSAPTIVLAAR
jgi:UrcA family protein